MFRGSFVALVTPMTEDGQVDYDALSDVIEFHIENQTDGIVSVGTTGESATLNTEEHCQVIRYTIEKVAGRVPVMAGTGANSTSEAIELTQCAKEAGADACLLVTPYYNKPTQEGLYLHHKAIAEAVDIPQMLYNVPGRTACDMLNDTVVRLSEIPNIIGIKDATGDLSRLDDLKGRVPVDFDLFSGDDGTAVEFILRGGHGGISVTANVAPKSVHDAYSAALEGDAERAQAVDAPLAALHSKLFLEANPIPVKWAMHRMGRMTTGIRLPLTVLSTQYQPEIEDALKQAGCINE